MYMCMYMYKRTVYSISRAEVYTRCRLVVASFPGLHHYMKKSQAWGEARLVEVFIRGHSLRIVYTPII